MIESLQRRAGAGIRSSLEHLKDIHHSAITAKQAVPPYRSSPGEYPFRDTGDAERELLNQGIHSQANGTDAAIGMSDKTWYMAMLADKEWRRLGFKTTWYEEKAQVVSILKSKMRKNI